MDLSVVTTMYGAEACVEEFHRRMTAAAGKITDRYEIILVNDGSPDAALDKAVALYRSDPHVKVIDLSRNFGHHKAAMTGLAHARGDLVFLIDVDLEEEPELLNTFYDLYRASDADVVYGVQDRRKGGLWERASGAAYWRLYGALASYPIPANLLMARLMSRRYVQALVAHREAEPDISGLWQITGFKQIPVTVRKHSMPGSTYTLRKKLELLVRSITGFSNRPLIFIAALGVVILTLATLCSLYFLGVGLFIGKAPSGFMSIILSIWFLGGLIIFSLGVIAIYLSVIFSETKNRPYTIVRDIYERDARESG